MKTTHSTLPAKSNVFYRSIACLAIGILAAGLSAQPFRLFSVSDMVRVYGDGYHLPPSSDTVRVFGIRGEVLSGQCVIVPSKNLSDVTVIIEAPQNPGTGRAFPGSAVEWDFVGSVPLEKNTPNQPPNALSRPAPALYPDYLMAEKRIDVSKGNYRSVWLTISIPGDAEAGTYAGRVRVQSAEGEKAIPLEVSVYPLDLPEDRHLKIVEWYSTREFSRFHGIEEEHSDEWFTMLGRYAENMVEHRQNTFRVPMTSIGITRTGEGRFEFDFSLFDKISQVFWNTGKMDYLETGFLARFGNNAWFSTEILLQDIRVTDSQSGQQVKLPGEEVVPHLLPAFEDHLRQKGWIDKTLFHIQDEPSLHNAVSWMDMSAYIHRFAPDLRRMDAIETTYLLDEIEVAVPKLDALGSWYDAYRQWQKQGNELWYYTVGIYQGSYFPNKTIDMPLIETRIMHWLNYRYDATGYLHWGWNQWDEDPYNDVGMHIGDAWHVYPVKDGVLNSLRWEEMRNGIQDYEYFWMLEQKICALRDSLGSRFAWIEPSRRGKEIAGRVVQSLTEHTQDPEVLNAARMQVIKELMEFDVSPRVYVQTDPLEGTTLTNHSSVGVQGWAEPGTKIIINGQEIPVSDQGLFLEQFGGDFIDPTKIHLGNVIRVEAISPDGSREIIRKFNIKY